MTDERQADPKHSEARLNVYQAIGMTTVRGYAASETVERLLYALTGLGLDDVDRKTERRLINKLKHASGTVSALLDSLLAAFVEAAEDAPQPKPVIADDDDAVADLSQFDRLFSELPDASSIDAVLAMESETEAALVAGGAGRLNQRGHNLTTLRHRREHGERNGPVRQAPRRALDASDARRRDRARRAARVSHIFDAAVLQPVAASFPNSGTQKDFSK